MKIGNDVLQDPIQVGRKIPATEPTGASYITESVAGA
jgi:hypothetical protein